MSLRLGFLGTGDFAVPALQALAAAGHELALVICQPDRPKGRGHHLQPPPVKVAASALGLEVWQPERLREATAVERFQAAQLDLACVVAYGQILPQTVLDAPRLGCVNVHASLLPRWRGAAPIEWALAAGDARTGVCVQSMVYQLDAGAVLLSEARELGPLDDGPTLHQQLAPVGARLLLQALAGLEAGTLKGTPQDAAGVTLAPLLKKADGWMDWSRPRREILNRFRAFKARPGVHTQVQGGDLLKVHGLSDAGAQAGKAGLVLALGPQGLQVACADGSLYVEKIQAPAATVMGAADYARGHGLSAGKFLVMPGEGI